MDYKPRYLGNKTNAAVTRLDLIPWRSERGTVVTLDCTEFTSFCPVTSQPDFGKLTIEYQPARSLVETKSVKLWMWSFREQKAFNEQVIFAIASEFFRQVKPRWVRVIGSFNTRGGIAVTAEQVFGKKK